MNSKDLLEVDNIGIQSYWTHHWAVNDLQIISDSLENEKVPEFTNLTT